MFQNALAVYRQPQLEAGEFVVAEPESHLRVKIMNPVKLTQLIYSSDAVANIDSSALKGILEKARLNNARHSITGMLLHTGGSFFQVLEGDESALTELFASISSDPRHTNVTRIIHEPIAQRAFGEWTMAFSEIDPADLLSIAGTNDFFHSGESFSDLKPGRAKKLLGAFAKGRWRARLDGGSR